MDEANGSFSCQEIKQRSVRSKSSPTYTKQYILPIDKYDYVILEIGRLDGLLKFLSPTCPQCSSPAPVILRNHSGGVLTLTFQCENGHDHNWSTSKIVRTLPVLV